MNRIYTRLGDYGTTTLLEGERQSKHAPVFQAIGELDELNAQLGLCVFHSERSTVTRELLKIQHALFAIGAQLAQEDSHEYGVTQTDIEQLENWIDAHWASTPPLTRFILPGGTLTGSQLHLARTVARRTERSVTALSEIQIVNPMTAAYLNRLSDYLFTAARSENHMAGKSERIWIANR